MCDAVRVRALLRLCACRITSAAQNALTHSLSGTCSTWEAVYGACRVPTRARIECAERKWHATSAGSAAHAVLAVSVASLVGNAPSA